MTLGDSLSLASHMGPKAVKIAQTGRGSRGRGVPEDNNNMLRDSIPGKRSRVSE